MVLPLIGAAIGGVLSGVASRSAAKTQAQAAQDAATAQLTATRESNDLLRDFRNEDMARFQPFYQGGADANAALLYEMGLGPRPTVGGTRNPLAIETFTETTPGSSGPQLSPAERLRLDMARDKARGSGMPVSSYYSGPMPGGGTAATETTRYRVGDQVFGSMEDAQAFANQNATTTGGQDYAGFTATPGYEFRRQSGIDAVQGSVAARQGLASGAALKGLERFGQDFASNEYGNYYNRLSNIAANGQNAAGMQASANQNYGGQIGANTIAGGNAAAQGFQQAGNASAAGTMGMANAFNNALGQGMGLWQTNQLMNAFTPGPSQASWNNANSGGGGIY